VSSLPKTVTRQCRGCDLNPGPSVPESSTLTTRLPSHPTYNKLTVQFNSRAANKAQERQSFMRIGGPGLYGRTSKPQGRSKVLGRGTWKNTSMSA